jgi:hypothetical protein
MMQSSFVETHERLYDFILDDDVRDKCPADVKQAVGFLESRNPFLIQISLMKWAQKSLQSLASHGEQSEKLLGQWLEGDVDTLGEVSRLLKKSTDLVMALIQDRTLNHGLALEIQCPEAAAFWYVAKRP